MPAYKGQGRRGTRLKEDEPDRRAAGRRGGPPTTEKRTQMEHSDLTEDQKRMARAAKSSEELVELAKTEGIELSDEQLEALSGGDSIWTDYVCSTVGNV